MIRSWGLRLRYCPNPRGIEDVGLRFPVVALSWNFFAI